MQVSAEYDGKFHLDCVEMRHLRRVQEKMPGSHITPDLNNGTQAFVS